MNEMSDMSDNSIDEQLIRRFSKALDELRGNVMRPGQTVEEVHLEHERALAGFTEEERTRLAEITAPHFSAFLVGEPDEHATHGDGDVRTAELARELNQHRDLPEGTFYLTSSTDVASEPFQHEIAGWGDDRNRFFFDHTLTIGLGRWCLDLNLSTNNALRPFAKRWPAGALGVTTWATGALGLEIELERYAS